MTAEELDAEFCLLADRPHFVPTLARWFWREWAPVYEVRVPLDG
jgi:hypothetical protein